MFGRPENDFHRVMSQRFLSIIGLKCDQFLTYNPQLQLFCPFQKVVIVLLSAFLCIFILYYCCL